MEHQHSPARTPYEAARELLERLHTERLHDLTQRQHAEASVRIQHAQESGGPEVRPQAVERIARIDQTQLRDRDELNRRELLRLDEIARSAEGQTLTGAQLARAALLDGGSSRNANQRRQLHREFNRQAQVLEAGQRTRGEIEAKALQDDLAAIPQSQRSRGPEQEGAFQQELARQQLLESQRRAEQQKEMDKDRDH